MRPEAGSSPVSYDGPWHQSDHLGLRLLANLFFVNQLWFTSIRPGSNGPFWSLGYEFWYYALFGVALYLRGHIRIVAALACMLFVGPKVLVLFPIWLMGVWAYRTSLAQRLSLPAALALFVGALAGYAAFRAVGGPDALDGLVMDWFGRDFTLDKISWSQYVLSSHVIGALIALNFVAARALARRLPQADLPFAGPIRHLAGLTFALYLFHYPLLQFFSAIADRLGIDAWRFLTVPIPTLIVVYLFGAWCERQKAPLKRLLLAAYDGVAARGRAAGSRGAGD